MKRIKNKNDEKNKNMYSLKTKFDIFLKNEYRPKQNYKPKQSLNIFLYVLSIVPNIKYTNTGLKKHKNKTNTNV